MRVGKNANPSISSLRLDGEQYSSGSDKSSSTKSFDDAETITRNADGTYTANCDDAYKRKYVEQLTISDLEAGNVCMSPKGPRFETNLKAPLTCKGKRQLYERSSGDLDPIGPESDIELNLEYSLWFVHKRWYQPDLEGVGLPEPKTNFTNLWPRPLIEYDNERHLSTYTAETFHSGTPFYWSGKDLFWTKLWFQTLTEGVSITGNVWERQDKYVFESSEVKTRLLDTYECSAFIKWTDLQPKSD